MTLKQLKTIEALPKENYNIGKAMLKGGYSKASSRAGTNYQRLRKITQKIDFLNPERIKKDIEYVYNLAKKKGDITNLSRNVEHRSKIAGMITDKSEVENKNPEKVIVVIGNKPKEIEETPENIDVNH